MASLNVRQLLDRGSLLNVLTVYSDLPQLLNQEALDYGTSLYMTQQDFLDELPCSVFVNAVANSTFVDNLSVPVLKAMTKVRFEIIVKRKRKLQLFRELPGKTFSK